VAAFRPLALRYSARARAQLIAIQEYLSERNRVASAKVGAGIREAAEVLRFFPYAGRSGRSVDTREWVVQGLPYILVYKIDLDANEIVILGVFHGAQRRE
jgi:plasmid stabilization system protein ParE